MTQLDERYNVVAGTVLTPRGESQTNAEDRDSIEYLYFKFMYMKAKTLRKTRKLQNADEVCQFLIDTVREKMPAPADPVPSTPAVRSGATVEEIKDEVIVEAPKPSETQEPKLYWKFAVKAAHLKVTMLANCMEFSKPKRLMYEFAEPVLVTLLKKFMPDIFTAEENRDDGIPASLSEKVLPDHYYSFQHRRVYAKLRRMGYYVGEAERLYRQLLHDELRFYDLYNFGKFEEDNPVVSEVPEDAEKPATDAKNAEEGELIEEVKVV